MLNRYIKDAMRTNSESVGTYNIHPDLIHGALLLADELIELKQAFEKCDRVNVLEELGDICWSVALIASRYGDNECFDLARPISPNPVSELEWSIGEAISIVKRGYAYGKKIDYDLYDMLCCIVECVSTLADKFDSSLEQVLDLNINKLSARYPERFTPEQANNRDTEREREVLERST